MGTKSVALVNKMSANLGSNFNRDKKHLVISSNQAKSWWAKLPSVCAGGN